MTLEEMNEALIKTKSQAKASLEILKCTLNGLNEQKIFVENNIRTLERILNDE